MTYTKILDSKEIRDMQIKADQHSDAIRRMTEEDRKCAYQVRMTVGEEQHQDAILRMKEEIK